MTRKYLTPVVIVAVALLCTAYECDNCNSSGSSGGSSGGGNSGDSGGSTTTITYNASYEFESVNLRYNYSSRHNSWQDMYLDAGDLYQAHGTDPTKLEGVITNLYNILENSDNYSGENKPKVEITFKTSDGKSTTHSCTKDDVGSNYVQNLPNFGTQINSMIVKVESITTPSNALKLCWSKTFDFNQSWWDFVEDKALSGNAKIEVGGYSKCIGSDRIFIARKVADEYVLVSYYEPTLLDGPVIDCDVEIVTTPIVTSPTLEGPIYINGKFDQQVMWAEPVALQVI